MCLFSLTQQPPPDLSIVPLDSTTSQFDALPLDLPSSLSLAGTSDLASLQAELSNFQDSVCAMVQQHVTATTQVINQSGHTCMLDHVYAHDSSACILNSYV